MLTFANVDYNTFRTECELLRQMHYLEVTAPRGENLALNHEFYEAVEDKLRIIIAYEGDLPVGYHIAMVTNGIHDENTKIAHTDMFFLDPMYRKGRNGIELLKVAEMDLGANFPGVIWRLSVPIDGPRDLGVLVERALGSAPVERVYQKTIAG